MCRLVGIISDSPTDFAFSLVRAPKSLAKLSEEHPHGWGVAVYEREQGWLVHKQPVRAGSDGRFLSASESMKGELMIAHVRKMTVGEMEARNTHPFQRGRWVFAHNGHISEVACLDSLISPGRAAEVQGDTDSERLFAYLLTLLDESGGADALGQQPQRALFERRLAAALRGLRERPGFGSFNFLLSDGQVVYAHRAGRTLFMLRRGAADVPRSSGTRGVQRATWVTRREAFLLASEQLTPEPWVEIDEGSLLVFEKGPALTVRGLDEQRVVSPEALLALTSLPRSWCRL